MSHYLYIIKCKNNYLYTGISHDLDKRINEHKYGLCRNTKNRLPIKLVYTETFKTIKDAAKREKEIKGWRREKKNNLFSINKVKVVYTES